MIEADRAQKALTMATGIVILTLPNRASFVSVQAQFLSFGRLLRWRSRHFPSPKGGDVTDADMPKERE